MQEIYGVQGKFLLQPRVVLRSVDQPGFDIKLEAFVQQSEDRFFLVLAINIFPRHRDLCRAHGIQILDLATFQQALRTALREGRWPHQVVITLAQGDLQRLVDTFFVPRPAGRTQYWPLLVSAGWWVLCGFVPALALLWEFGWEGMFFAQLYPHFFFLPLLWGWLLICGLLPPLRVGLRAISSTQRWGVALLVLIGALFCTWADGTQSDLALWEFKDVLTWHLPDGSLVHKQARWLVEQCAAGQALALQSVSSGTPQECQRQQQALSQALREQEPQARKSVTWFFYLLSLFLQTATMGISMLVLGTLLVLQLRRHRMSMSVYKHIFVVFLIYYALWVPLRLFCIHEKIALYGQATYLGELPIIILMTIAYIYVVTLGWRTYRNMPMLFGQIALGIVPLFYGVYDPEILVRVVGHQTHPVTYPMLFLAALMVLLPWWLLPAPPTSDFG